MSGSRRLLGACLRASGLQQHAASSSSSAAGVLAAHERCAWQLPSRREEEQRPQQQQPLQLAGLSGAAPASLALQGLLANPLLRRSTNSPLAVAPLAPMATRGIATLSSARLGGVSAPLGLGLGLPARQGSQLLQGRTYLTEGQLLGTSFLVATDIMFWSGLIGAVIFRRNLIVMLLATEIVMLACNLNFLFASAYFNDMTGVMMSITITTIAACETAIGLALCVTYFHLRSATDVEVLNFLK